jgi:hypothetical protein
MPFLYAIYWSSRRWLDQRTPELPAEDGALMPGTTRRAETIGWLLGPPAAFGVGVALPPMERFGSHRIGQGIVLALILAGYGLVSFIARSRADSRRKAERT